MAQTKYDKVYKGDTSTFRDLLMQYSCDRMDRDPIYRRDVRKAVAERRNQRRAARATRPAAKAA